MADLEKRGVPYPLCLCVLLAAFLLWWPNAREVQPPWAALAALLLMALCYLHSWIRRRGARAAGDILTLVLVLFFLWELCTAKLNLANPVVIPPPENVFMALIRQRAPLLRGVVSSMELLATGFAVALPLGVALGMLVGWTPRLKECLFPVAKVISSVPPSIYSPYIIAVMPTFRSASAMVLVLGLFWPTFLNTVLRIGSMEKRLLDASRVLSLGRGAMFLHILLPYLLPGVISSLHVQLSTSFLLLTLAEMLGASSGMGYFVRNNADYANYANVIAGILVVGVMVTLLNRLITCLEKKLIHWSY